MLAASLSACRPTPEPPRVGAPAEVVATPFAGVPAYARNVWDMQRFGGRIYVGHGDSNGNRGPITVWSLDPATARLTRAFKTNEHQVDAFRVLNGELYVPGHDPRDGWSRGNFYRLEPGGWAKHRTIPHGVHAFDLAWHGGRLFAALGGPGKPGQATLLASTDRGRTWSSVTDEVQRVYTLFELRGRLYAAPRLRTAPDPGDGSLLRYDGARFVRTGIGGAQLLPGLPDTAGRMVRPVEFRDALVYVVATGTFGWKPAALAITRTLHDARTVALPHPEAVPYDLLARDSTLYALAAAPAPSGGYTVFVYASEDVEHWRELFRFAAPTFARSFEESAGDFFFGLGSTYQAPSPATGTILRVRAARYRDTPPAP